MITDNQTNKVYYKNTKKKPRKLIPRLSHFYAPTHEVVPNAVTIAVAMVAIR